MKTYAGIDLHASNNFIGVIDAKDKRLYRKSGTFLGFSDLFNILIKKLQSLLFDDLPAPRNRFACR